jgi:ribonuclease Z
MPRLIILGTSNAVPSEDHENTHMVLVGGERSVLIDCVSSPILRLEHAGVKPIDLTDLILTHFHPDHVSGVPLLLMDMWLMGRRGALNIHGLDYTLNRVEQLMDAFDWSNWPGFFPVNFNSLSEKEMTQVMDCEEWRLFSSPVRHLVPTIGVRVEFASSNKVLAYSSDTEPCPQVLRLADDADTLIHESTGEFAGHSSAAQAGQVAAEAQAKSLFLIHYNTRQFEPEQLLADARKSFGGEVKLARDLMELEF